jgi:hypothetical protein
LWFLKSGAKLNMSSPADAELYVQQVMTKGNLKDVRKLLESLGEEKTKQIFLRIKNFLPLEVRRFWEGFFGYFY